MTEQDDSSAEPVPVGRVPGKYIVIGMLVFGVIFLGCMLVLSLRLTPAADRFHNQPATAHPK